jgi:hypothetical protein
MPLRYWVRNRHSGTVRHIQADEENRFFELIQRATGLDRAIVTAILSTGEIIDHPAYQFGVESRAADTPDRRQTENVPQDSTRANSKDC